MAGRMLALDFDGVISDSAPESFIVALSTYTAMRPESSLTGAARELGGADLATIVDHPLYRGFLGLMPLGNRAEDFSVALYVLDRGLTSDDQASQDRHRRAQPEGFLEAFHERFYRERDRMATADPGGWLALLGPYPIFVEILRRRGRNRSLALATAKDRRSVDRLLAAYGVADLFPPERILDKETGTSKRAHLRALVERTAVDYGSITFVDDKVNHLEDVARLGVRCVLAAWGYNGEREHAIARAMGFKVCDLEEAERELFDVT